MVKKISGYCTAKIQGLSIYKRLLGLARHDIEIKESDSADRPNVTDFIAKDKNKVIGFIQLVRLPENMDFPGGHWLFSLRVDLFYRRMGIGSRLVEAVIKRASDEGARDLFFLVNKNNHRAIKLYLKSGFKRKIIPGLEEKLEKEKLLTKHRRIVMAKTL